MPTPSRLRSALPLSLIAALLLAACHKSDPGPSQPVAGDEAAADTAAGSVSLELRNEPVDAVAEKLASAAGKPIAIDADAQAVAHCARITLFTGGPVPLPNAIRLLREALDPAGLSLIESEAGGLVVRRIPDKPLPATCAGSVGAQAAPSESAHPPSEASAEKFAAGVRKISETEYELTQASADLLRDDQTGLVRSARFVPAQKDGKIVGVKLFGMRPSSVLATLGLQNGDLVLDLGGYALTGPDLALEAYAKLKGAKKVEMTIERRGATQKFVYRVVEK
ncbi:hypothetical protein [Polyangium mundeleinium]|uniref:PDZ domain-containing protein n=1 Tax=Polyangium mundeleinium TaxID=2995306 RepID=A0ABT5EXH7_9BACT|nr:hypothetical protein [Polyangium mundeleinium]MDC0746506.1 hypothetical protein [Polyangium mundeleinium]